LETYPIEGFVVLVSELGNCWLVTELKETMANKWGKHVIFKELQYKETPICKNMNARFHALIRRRRRKIESVSEKNAENYVWT